MTPTASPAPDPTVLWLPTSTWDVLGTIFQIAAIVVGGIWAYRAFIKKREEFPRASVKHGISHLALDKERVLLRAEITVSNSGLVLLKMVSGIFRIDQVLLLPDGMPQAIKDQKTPLLGSELRSIGLQLRYATSHGPYRLKWNLVSPRS
jgi:hypothetical protein